ncbi:GNAT family N-acetyltransferase [Gordonia jinhuaensis]|uniref:GNAT family acetyltransferase n=2 Tax=Gordonia jinhuaensis TaxID=1517702 RepID=A0A916WTI6_9ACTN|nr:GNAT family acetyltransferase [Gordonia jinhuaensis]
MVLRPVTTADAEHLVVLDADPEVMRHVSGGVATPPSIIEDWVIPRAISEMNSRPGVGIWIAVDRRRGDFLGWVSLRAPRHGTRPELELTYRLRRAAWGRGLATEGARAVIALAFDLVSTDRVFAGTTAINHASRRVMEKSGMSLVAATAADPQVEYELLRDQWTSHSFPWAASARPVAHLIA